jgi:glycosyltransferase involved in cell wall biosynthesis
MTGKGTTDSPPVALLFPTLEGGGAQRVMLTLAEGLAARGKAVELVLIDQRGELAQQLDPELRVVNLGKPHARLALPGLIRYLRQRRPACLLSTLDHTSVLALIAGRLAGTRTPVVIRISNKMSERARHATTLGEKLTVGFSRRLFPMANRIVAVSAGAARDFEEYAGLEAGRVEALPNPVVDDRMLQLAAMPVDHPWFAGGLPPVVLGVGRLVPQKNFELLIRAFALVRKTTDARLLILGEGPLRPQLVRTADELGVAADLDLPGFDPNPFRYMAHAGVFVLSSDYEGLPGVLIQAMASGAPVVSTDCPFGPREILRNGRYGRLVPTGNAEEMAGAIINALTMGDGRVREAAWEPYSSQTALDAYWRVISEAIEGSAGRLAAASASPHQRTR